MCRSSSALRHDALARLAARAGLSGRVSIISMSSRFYRRRAPRGLPREPQILGRLNGGLQKISPESRRSRRSARKRNARRFQEINFRYRERAAAEHPLQCGVLSRDRTFARSASGCCSGTAAICHGQRDPTASWSHFFNISSHVPADPRLAEKYNIMQAAMASSERIFALLETAEQIRIRRNRSGSKTHRRD